MRRSYRLTFTIVALLGLLGPLRSVQAADNARGIEAGIQGAYSEARSYRIVDLGTLPGGAYSAAWGINERGWVVGESATSQNEHAFLWRDGAMTDLGALSGGSSSAARAINARGQIVGYADTPDGTHAAMWTPDGRIQALATPDGAVSIAFAINARGIAVGSTRSAGVASTASWERGGYVDLGPGISRNFGANGATGISRSGDIVGNWERTAAQGSYLLTDKGISDLTAQLSLINAINDRHEVVGAQGSAPQARAILYNYRTGQRRDLGTTRRFSIATGLNNAGQIVGYSGGTAPNDLAAFLWQGGAMVELNTLLPLDTRWYALNYAAGINDAGWIVGYGLVTADGQRHAFLLQPIAR